MADNLSKATEPIRPLNLPTLSPTAYSPPVRTSVIDKYIQKTATVDMLVFPPDLPDISLRIGIGEYKRTGVGSVASVLGQGGIHLPVPTQMRDHHGVSYSQQALGLILGSAWNAAASTANSLANISDIIKKTATAAEVAAKNGETIRGAGVGAARFGLSLLPQPVQDAVGAALGIAPNQFLTIVFQGPAYKKYQFSWRLAPRSVEESFVIRRIIRTLHKAAAPSLGIGSFFFSYPSVIQCAFSNGDQMYGFKPAVLTNVEVNYTPGGFPSFYKDGYPEAVDISLGIIELEFWLKENFE